MAESFPMNGGDGNYSYTKNSQYQKQLSDFAKEMMKEAILEKLDTENLRMSISTTLLIVDFGCSVGPNTFFAVQNLIETVQKKLSFHGLDFQNIEFQVFFNDHTTNDFNMLFASLPQDRQYYAAGAPGSFHSRLFPRASITLAYSSFALQWLSRVPEGLSDSKSGAWNEGRIHYPRSSREVVNAYADQFEKDMTAFISARAKEIVSGGLMFLIIPGIPEEATHFEFFVNFLFRFLECSLLEMATEGIIDKSEIDSFNLPVYIPTAAEMTKLIEKNGCFSTEKIELTDPGPQVHGSLNAHSVIMLLRAGVEGLLTKHFGHGVMEKIFDETLAKSKEITHFLEYGYPSSTILFIALKRK